MGLLLSLLTSVSIRSTRIRHELNIVSLFYRGDLPGIQFIGAVPVVVRRVYPLWDRPSWFFTLNQVSVLVRFLTTRDLHGVSKRLMGMYEEETKSLPPPEGVVLRAMICTGMHKECLHSFVRFWNSVDRVFPIVVFKVEVKFDSNKCFSAANLVAFISIGLLVNLSL